MNKIEIVDVYHSSVSHLNGIDIGPGFAVIIDPHPASEENIIRVTQAIRNALEGLKMEDES